MKILGISCYYHDAAAALVVDGKIVACSVEERFSRKKHDSSFPDSSINFCLEQAGLRSEDIDWVVFYEKPLEKFERLSLTHLAIAPSSRNSFVGAYKTWLKDKLWIKSHLADKTGIGYDKILFCKHHISHAASSYYTSNYKSSALLTVDGVGEWTTTAWGKAKNNKLILEKEIKFPHSLGLFYSAFTQFLGFRINNGEFKVMGLAPYGKPVFVDKVEKLITQTTNGAYKLDMDYFSFHKSQTHSFNQKFINLLGVRPQDPVKNGKIIGVYADIAASVQKVLNEKLLVIAKHVKKETGEDNLCYAGGVALNGVANWEIFRKAGFKNIYIHPAAGDDGGAVGSALYLYHHVLGNSKPRKSKFSSVYLGQNITKSQVDSLLVKRGIQAKKYSNKKLVKVVAQYLAKGKVVGWVQGRFEWGPRALGARSILADPRSKRMKDVVNKKIKFREGFRPFAPVALWETGHKYFEVEKGRIPQMLEYMMAVVPVRKKWRQKLGAVTHVNGTARPQFIKRAVNPLYYDLIKEFGKITGVDVLLNTSFNLKGEPIVNTPEEAHNTFENSQIDNLVMGNHVVTK